MLIYVVFLWKRVELLHLISLSSNLTIEERKPKNRKDPKRVSPFPSPPASFHAPVSHQPSLLFVYSSKTVHELWLKCDFATMILYIILLVWQSPSHFTCTRFAENTIRNVHIGIKPAILKSSVHSGIQGLNFKF